MVANRRLTECTSVTTRLFQTARKRRFDQVCDYIIEQFPNILTTKLGNGPHFMILFAAVTHALFGIPEGDMKQEHGPIPQRDPLALTDLGVANSNLMALADLFDISGEDVPERLINFKLAIAGSTQRIKSRAVRFHTIFRALLPSTI